MIYSLRSSRTHTTHASVQHTGEEPRRSGSAEAHNTRANTQHSAKEPHRGGSAKDCTTHTHKEGPETDYTSPTPRTARPPPEKREKKKREKRREKERRGGEAMITRQAETESKTSHPLDHTESVGVFRRARM